MKKQNNIAEGEQTKKLGHTKILMCSYKFPPIKSIGSNRNFNVYTQFKQHFKSVFVLTTSNRHFLLQEKMAVDEQDVTTAFTFDYRSISRFFYKPKTNIYSTAKKRGIWFFLGKLLNSFPFNFMGGEGGFIYILTAFYKTQKLVKAEKIKFIYSSYRPYSDHLVALLLKRWNPELYWIADFRDLHVDPVVDSIIFRGFQKWCNRKILAKANLISTVSVGLSKHLSNFGPEVLVMRNNISERLLQSEPLESYEKFTLVYTGSILPLYQKATYFFKALKEFIRENNVTPDRFQLIYAGNTSEYFLDWVQTHQLDPFYQDNGFVPFQDALNMQRKAHLNLLFSWATPEITGTLCGKLNEYLSAQKPILCLIEGSRDEEFEHIFEELNAGLVAYNNESQVAILKSFLHQYYQDWKVNGKINHHYKVENLKHYTWEYNMDLLREKLEEEL